MKKLLKAFTLAEILITLGIVGVVARLTLPALNGSVSEKTAITSLSKAINTLQVANQNALTSAETKTLSGAAGSTLGAIGKTPSLYANLLSGEMQATVRTINGLDTLITKDGLYFMFETNSQTTPVDHPDKFSGYYLPVIVDINGKSKPNSFGEDRFYLYIDEFGAVIPAGGYEWKQYNNNAEGIETWEDDKCGPDASPAPVDAKKYCTGSIVDNDYKIVYKI